MLNKRQLQTAKTAVFILYALLIILLSLTPGDPEIGLAGWDKVGHFLAYAGMAGLAFLTFRSKNGRFLALLFTIALGFLLEWIQSFIPARTMGWGDALANSLGVLVGTAVFFTQQKRLTQIYQWVWAHLQKEKHNT